MKKRSVYLGLLGAILTISLVLGACTPAAAPAKTVQAPAKTVQAPAKTVEVAVAVEVEPEYIWRFQTPLGPGGQIGYYVMETFANAVKARTDGRVQLDLYTYSGLNVAGPDLADAVGTGQIDGAEAYGAYLAGKFPHLIIRENYQIPYDQPLLQQLDRDLASLYNDTLDAVNVIPIITGAGAPITIFTNTEITDWTELKGQVMRSYGKTSALLYEHLEIEPVSLAASEVAEATTRGTIDGFMTAWDAGVFIMKAPGYTKVIMDMSLTPAGLFVLLNKDRFNELPADLQEAVTLAAEDAYWAQWGLITKWYEKAKAEAVSKGLTIVPWPAEAQALVNNAGDDLLEWWKDQVDPSYHPWWDVVQGALADQGY